MRHSLRAQIAQRYRVLGYLGEGAQSYVYLVSDNRRPQARWALKQLRLSELPESERPSALSLFQREGEILARLHHQALPKLIDQGHPTGEDPYLVMERVLGQPLDELLAQRLRPLRVVEALPLALQITHLLGALHHQDPPIIYRDLKPSNLILAPSGMVRLIDFGIARFRTPTSTKDTQELGTPGFCAPEQYRGHSWPQSDIYSLGVTLYYMLTLRDPQSMSFRFPPLEEEIGAPPALSQLVARCLELDHTKRPADLDEVRCGLFQVLQNYHAPQNRETQPLTLGLQHLSRHLALLEEL